MNFRQSILSAFKKILQFKGRASRSEYWWFELACTLTFIIYIASWAFFFLPRFEGSEEDMISIWGFLVITTITGLFIGIPNISLTVRRLHDLNLSGWWSLISPMATTLLKLLKWGAGDVTKIGITAGDFQVLQGISLLIIHGVYIYYFTRKGTSGPNKYGPDPLEEWREL